MRERRLLHIFSTFESGGQQVRTCAILNALGRRFTHVVVPASGSSDAARLIAPSVRFELMSPPPGKGSMAYAWRFRHLIRKLRPDLVLTYNWGAFDAVLGGYLAGVCPVLHTEDGFCADEADGLKRRRVWSRRVVLNRTSGMIVPSRTLANIAVKRFGVHPRLVKWIPNGIDTDRFAPRRNDSLRRAWGIAPDEVLFGFAGRLGAEKNLNLAIQALAQAHAPTARLALIGDGPCREDLESHAARLGVAGRVLFVPKTADIAPFYNALDAFLLTSRTEQMPLSLLEAMASGLPAICTNVGDCSEMLSTRDFPYLVPSGDVAKLASALETVAASPSERATAGSANRARVLQQYKLEEMISAYERIYDTGTV
jgi:glycosyltransferase involved in cell wall biosynthesis